MKSSNEKRKPLTQEEIMDQVQKILEERGSKALEMTRQAVLEEKIECKEIREALRYFMTEYWNDLVRPTLMSLVCEAVGGDPKLTNTVAIPMILISGAMDIHDDIIDESKVKQKRPTVFGKFGKNIALLVGDALMVKGLILLDQSLKTVSNNKRKAILETIHEMFFQLGDAEASELQFRGRVDVTPKDYLRVVRKKAADVEAHIRISAILGNASREQLEALANYGRLLGMLVILRDDLIDWMDPEEALHRIKKEHLPLPVLYVLQNPKVRPTISCYVQKREITKKIAKDILETTREARGFERSMEIMETLSKNAFSSLQVVKRNKNLLELLIRCLIQPIL